MTAKPTCQIRWYGTECHKRATRRIACRCAGHQERPMVLMWACDAHELPEDWHAEPDRDTRLATLSLLNRWDRDGLPNTMTGAFEQLDSYTINGVPLTRTEREHAMRSAMLKYGVEE